MAVAAVAVTGALLTAGAAIGGAVGGRIEHPGHLLVVVVLSLLVDSFSVFHTAGPTAAVVARPELIAVLALPWPRFGTSEFLPVLGVGDVVFAALYMSTARQFGLPRLRTAPHRGQGLGQPERGGQVAQIPVHAVLRVPLVPPQHPAAVEVPRDAGGGAAHPLVTRGQEAHLGQAKQARVGTRSFISLNETRRPGVVPALEHVRPDVGAEPAPPLGRSRITESFVNSP